MTELEWRDMFRDAMVEAIKAEKPSLDGQRWIVLAAERMAYALVSNPDVKQAIRAHWSSTYDTPRDLNPG